MRMMVFDRHACRWRTWHGTRAAWLKLPHVAATGVCLLATAALRAAAPLPAYPAHAHRESPHIQIAHQPAASSNVPQAVAFLPSLWLSAPNASGSGTQVAVGRPRLVYGDPLDEPRSGLTVLAAPNVIPTNDAPPAPVPEPGSFPLLLAGLASLAATRRFWPRRRRNG